MAQHASSGAGHSARETSVPACQRRRLRYTRRPHQLPLRPDTHLEINTGPPGAAKTKGDSASSVGRPSPAGRTRAPPELQASRLLTGMWRRSRAGKGRAGPAVPPLTAPVRCPPGSRLHRSATAKAIGPSPPPRLPAGTLFSRLYLPARRLGPNSHLPNETSGLKSRFPAGRQSRAPIHPPLEDPQPG